MKKKVTTHHQFQAEEYVLYQAIKDFQSGNKEKATVIYENSKQYSYNIIYRQISKFISQNIISGDGKAIVEDIMQEVYMEFFKNITEFRNEEPKSFYKWLTVVSNRKVLRYVDKNKMEVLQKEQKREFDEYDIDFSMEAPDEEENYSEFIPDMVLEEKEFQKLMKRFVRKLPEEQAQTIIYHVYGGLKYQEIADIMGVSLITVKTRMRKAKDSLKEMILEYEKKTGTKLNGVVPLPLIGFFLRLQTDSSRVPVSVGTKLIHKIRELIEPTTPGLVRQVEAFVEAVGMKSVVAGIVVTTVVGTGTVGIVHHNLTDSFETELLPIVQEQEEKQEDEQKKPKQDVSKQDTLEQATTQQEASKLESLKQEISNSDTSQQEMPDQEEVDKIIGKQEVYFIYWNNQSIDVTSYVHEGEYYEDPVYGKMMKWWIREDALLKLPLTKKMVSGKTVYCHKDDTYQYEFSIDGNNAYTINGHSFTGNMEVKVVDGEKYINPYHLQESIFGASSFVVGGGAGADFIAIKTAQSNQSNTSPSQGGQMGGGMGSLIVTFPPEGGYIPGDTYAIKAYEHLLDCFETARGAASLITTQTSFNYFDSIYASYDNSDGAWMYIRIAKWITDAKVSENYEDKVYGDLLSDFKIAIQSLCGSVRSNDKKVENTVCNLISQYYHPKKVPTQGIIEEDIPGLYVTLTQSPDGLEIRFFPE